MRNIRTLLGLVGDDQVITDEDLEESVDELFSEGLSVPKTYQAKPEEKLNLVLSPSGKASYPRSAEKAAQALLQASFLCEFDNSHGTFKRKSNGKPYTEPHHLIPISNHKDFANSLDIEANIVSLCSHCHNLLHYGADIENILLNLYTARIEDLEKAEISVTFDRLLGYYKKKNKLSV